MSHPMSKTHSTAVAEGKNGPPRKREIPQEEAHA
jgi:hypothetical protein